MMTEWSITGQMIAYLLLIWCLIALRTITTSTHIDETTRRTIMVFITVVLLIIAATIIHEIIVRGWLA